MNEAAHGVLVINPGSTSTKVALFRGVELVSEATLSAPGDSGGALWEEFEPRLRAIEGWVGALGSPGPLDAVVGRGGLLRPVEGGAYRVNDRMIEDAREGVQGVHASNLGCALARAVAEAQDPPVPALVVDPVATDEFEPLARYSGLREIPRKSLSHALSIHALVREVCRRDGRPVEGTRFVVAHLGGGISVCPVRDGRIIDANNANSGGPFSPSRAGGLPTQELLDLACSGARTERELRELTLKKGGLMSHLGTDDAEAVERLIEGGDGHAEEVYRAMGYQIAKEIGAMATVLSGEVEAILITGGLARSSMLTAWIQERVSFIAPVEVLPQIEEMRALALGAREVLSGEAEAKTY
jgi:butyrate kinase